MIYDGARGFVGLAVCAIGGWLLALSVIGFWPAGLITGIAILWALRYLLHFYNQLEQRDLDEWRS